MKFKPTTNESQSEAEETNQRESDLENELGFESEGDYNDEEEYGSESVCEDEEFESGNERNTFIQDLSPCVPSPVRRPLKPRAKRKYTLNDSTDEDIEKKKTPMNTNMTSTSPCGTPQSTRTFRRENPNLSSTKSPKINSFVSSSSLTTKENNPVAKASQVCFDSDRNTKTSEWNFKKRASISASKTPDCSKKDYGKTGECTSLSSTFEFDWDNGFSDSDLLDAVESNHKNDALTVACSAKNTNTL
jgi:hypothetical protein